MSREEMQERAQYQETYFIDQGNILFNADHMEFNDKDKQEFYYNLPLKVRNEIAIKFAPKFANKWNRVELTHNRRK